MQENMLFIEDFEDILREATASDKVNSTLVNAYCVSRELGHSRLDFSEVIWNKDVKPVIEALRRLGVQEFTISNTSCGLLKTLALFEAHGAKVQGLTSVKGSYLDFTTGNPTLIPALLMKIE